MVFSVFLSLVLYSKHVYLQSCNFIKIIEKLSRKWFLEVFQVYFESIRISKYTSGILWNCFWNAYKREYLRFWILVIHFLIQKFIWRKALLIYMYLFPDLEVYLKYGAIRKVCMQGRGREVKENHTSIVLVVSFFC